MSERIQRAYVIRRDLPGRIGNMAESLNVSQNDLVSNLLAFALGQIERGELFIRTAPTAHHISGIGRKHVNRVSTHEIEYER